jgi:hypothetical protein
MSPACSPAASPSLGWSGIARRRRRDRALFDVYERQSGPHMLLTFPEKVWEVTFGVYLIAEGFTSPATQREAEPRRATTAVPVIG